MNKREEALEVVGKLQDSIYALEGDGGFYARSDLNEQIGGFGQTEIEAIEDAIPECWRLGGFIWIDGKWELKEAA